MNVEKSVNKFFQINLTIRIITYFFLSILYLQIMKTNSPAGVGWNPLFLEKINIAVDNILEKSILLKYGLTSYSEIKGAKNLELYLIQAYYFLPYFILKLLGGKFLLIKIGAIFTNTIIISTGVIGAEISRLIFLKSKLLMPNLSSLFFFLLFISCPWTYRMILFPYQDIYFFLFIFSSLLMLLYNKKNLALILFLFGSLFNYQWSFLISTFYLILLLIGFYYKRINIISIYFPIGFRELKQMIKITLIGYISSFIVAIQNLAIIFSSEKIVPTNTSALYRIGIGNYNSSGNINLYHGGWLGAIEFLGGDRITGCFANNIELLKNLINLKIFPSVSNSNTIFSIYSCVLSIFGIFVLSIISLIGLVIFLKKYKKEFAWIFLPLIFALLSFVGIFQQLWHTHLSYYSYFFSMIFSFGIVIFYQMIIRSLKVNNYLAKIFSLPIFSAILINLIRVSYLSSM